MNELKYTTSLEADKKIQEDIDIINKIILNYFTPRAIVMFGGFGHGGGSFKKRTRNGKTVITPLNDYDLYIIQEKNIDGEKLEKVGEECSHALGRGGVEIVENFDEKYDENKCFHVDLHFVNLKKLKKLHPTQRSFDLKTSRVVWGDEKVLSQIPDIKVSKSDAIRLLFNKLDHFQIAENNTDEIKSIYAIKGLTDLSSALLIVYGNYVSKYQEKAAEFSKLEVPLELKRLVKKATEYKLNFGYEIKDYEVDYFFKESKKWVEWSLKKILKDYFSIESNDWKTICSVMYRKLPYTYFNDYLGSNYLFPAQYYLNLRFFSEAYRKKEFLPKALARWRDTGIILGICMMLYSFGEHEECEKYLKKITNRTHPLRERLMKLYSIYYLQKLV